MPTLTRLDEVGRLSLPIPDSEIASWKQELHSGGADKDRRDRAAVLHLWIGEWELTAHEEPKNAEWHFRQAQHLAGRSDRTWGIAAYDRGLVQYFEGDYDSAKGVFASLLDKKGGAGLHGFSRANCALWLKHAAACYGYHAQIGELGIPRPPRLDPLCGAGGLAACLRAMGRPYDKATILKACRVTGRGSNAVDILKACPKLGLVGRFVTADDSGLKRLPKPCIAYVEHDHFVTVLHADDRGMSYMCTDCGAWPGGEVKLDWKQWHALEATGYITVTRPGSLADNRLAALGVTPPRELAALRSLNEPSDARTSRLSKTAFGDGIQIASSSPRGAAFGSSRRAGSGSQFGTLSRAAAGMSGHVVVAAMVSQATAHYDDTLALILAFECGYNPFTQQCSCPIGCPIDGIGPRDAPYIPGTGTLKSKPKMPGHGFPGISTQIPVAPPHPPRVGYGVAAGAGDPVNLATLEEEYMPGADLTVYNPNGPSVHWHREYESLRGGQDESYEYDDFGMGWTHGYNYAVHSTVYVGPVDTGGPHPLGHTGPGGGGTPTPPTDPQYVVYPNGSRIAFTIPSMPTTSTPSVVCSVQAGEPLLVTICLNTSAGGTYPEYYFLVTFSDQTLFRFDRPSFSASYYPPTRISDRIGNAIDLVYDSASGLNSYLPVLTEIDDESTSTALLTIDRSSTTGAINSVTDCYGRSVHYTTTWHASSGITPGFAQGAYELDAVSQIATATSGTPAARYTLGYTLSGNSEFGEEVPYLHTITVPSPTGTGTATATINYDTVYGCFVDSIVDANGNKHQYIPIDANHTQVLYKDPMGAVVYSHTVGFNADMSQTTDTDGQVDGTGANTNVVYTRHFADPYDPYRPSSISDAVGRNSYFTWDVYGHPQTATDTRGTVTTDTWDYTHFPLGRLTSVQTGAKAATTATYNEPSGLIASVTAPAPSGSGVSTVTASATYSALGNLLTITGPGNNAASTVTTTVNYTTDGTYTQSEALGRPLTVTDNLGHTSHLRYDTLWRTSAAWDALGHEWDATYDISGQTLTTTAPATGMSGPYRAHSLAVYQYDGGALAAVKAYDESGSTTPIRQVNYTYGAEGEGLGVSGSTTETATFAYDAAYRVTGMTDGAGHTTTWRYGNAAGYLDLVTFPDTHTVQLTSYDATGRLLQSIDQDGLTANCTYGDIAGALTAISYPGHTSENVTYTHDSYGRTTNTTDAESSYSCTFGDRDETITGTRTYTGLPARTLTFAYYPNGSRKSMQLPVAPSGYTNSNCYTYEYDAGGRLTELDDNLGHTNTFSYDANDQIAGQVSGNGLTLAITRNELGQGTDLLNTLSTGGPSALFVSEFNDPSYDGAGNLTGITAVNGTSASLGGTSTYSYDTKDQLTSESNTATGAIISNSFAYDGAGNATTFRGTSRSFNAANEFSGTGFAYDDRGNPTTYAGSTCTFDVFNRATSLGTALTAGYRTDGMRAWKQDGSGTRTYYLYDGTSPLVEMDSSGNYKSEFVYGPAGLISHSRASLPTVFFAYDALGSVQSLWSDSGSLVSSRVYDAYGSQAGGIAASSTYDDPEIGYNGQAGYITDPETGLVICGHRYYDPSAGRWLNRDPIGYAGGINTYAYCTNNPVMGVDPSGLDADWAHGPGGPDSYWDGGGCDHYVDDDPTSDQISQLFGGNGGAYSGLTGDPGEDNALNAANQYASNMPHIGAGGEEETAVHDTLNHIDAGTIPPWRGKWGVNHSNREGNLPGVPGAGGYLEYYVPPPPGTRGPGARRIVISKSDGSVYYTNNHYGQSGSGPPFTKIRSGTTNTNP